MNKEEFVKRAIEIHGNKYDYSKTIYKNIKTNIKYIYYHEFFVILF